MPISFARRRIDLTFTLPDGQSLGTGGNNSVKFSGLRVSAEVTVAGVASGAFAKIRVEGLTQSLMAQLSQAKSDTTAASVNNVLIEAGDDTSGMSVVFQGGIYEAFADYAGAPAVAFVANAFSTLLPNAIPIAPTSYKGGASVSTIMAAIAGKAGLGFQDGGVTAVLQNPYFPGTAGEQIDRCARAANASWLINNLTLYIWPQGGSMKTTEIPLISAQSGLIGYPSYSKYGVGFRIIFNPQLQYWERVQVQSNFLPGGSNDKQSPAPATATYYIYSIVHSLQSETPDGAWFSDVNAASLGNSIKAIV